MDGDECQCRAALGQARALAAGAARASLHDGVAAAVARGVWVMKTAQASAIAHALVGRRRRRRERRRERAEGGRAVMVVTYEGDGGMDVRSVGCGRYRTLCGDGALDDDG